MVQQIPGLVKHSWKGVFRLRGRKRRREGKEGGEDKGAEGERAGGVGWGSKRGRGGLLRPGGGGRLCVEC
jgi:hypothetical protein